MTIVICDICKKEESVKKRHFTCREALGGAIEDGPTIYYSLELCTDCELAIYKQSLEAVNRKHPEIKVYKVISEEIEKLKKSYS